ncbi:MAG: serine/threonine-protein kinase [Thermoanaerobaculia bacterium]
MAFFCISCKSSIESRFKACPFCGEPITDFLRRYLEEPIDGKYKILSRLGIGGMGEVYKVVHTHLNQVRVIKLMRPNIMKEEGAQERFLREARLATRIHHPNVAALYDFSGLPDGSFYMVWEYIDGTNLGDLIRGRGCLSPRYAARLAAQALTGLDAIHRAGVVHRDISPENIMITKEEDGEEKVKIIDLGIAKQLGEMGDDKTKTGMFVGKWKYCSPEHLGIMKEGEKIDGRSDLYSFGIVMYEMLTGTPPFQADSPHRYLLLHATETPKPLAVANPSNRASAELEALIFKALEKDRGNRFASAHEFAKRLESIIPSLDDTAATPVATGIEEWSTQEVALGTESTIAINGLRQADQTAVTMGNQPRTVTSQILPAGVPGQKLAPTAAAATAPLVLEDWIQEPTRAQAAPTLIEPAPKSRSIMPIAALAAGIVVVAVIAFVLMSRAKSTGTAPVSMASVPVGVVKGSLGVNAFPWAEIEIKDLARGTKVETGGQLFTPAWIDLPPGRYELTMRNPRVAKPVTREVRIEPQSQEMLMVELMAPSRAAYPDFDGRN